MKKQLIRALAAVGAAGLGVTPAWAHPSPDLHVHSGEIVGLVAASLVAIIALLARGRAPRREP